MEFNDLYDIVSRGLSVRETLGLLREAMKAANETLRLELFHTPNNPVVVWHANHSDEIHEIIQEELASASAPAEPELPLFKPQVEWPEGTECFSGIPSFKALAPTRVGMLVRFFRRLRNELRRFGYGESRSAFL